MAAAYVNSGNFTAGSSSSPLTTGTLGWTPAVGNVLYAMLRLGNNASATSPSLSDSVNGSYTALGSWVQDGGSGVSHAQWFKVTVGTATAPTFTFSWTGGAATYTLLIVEVSGGAAETLGSAGTGSSTTPTCGNVVASGAGLLLAGYASVATQQTYSSALDNSGGGSMTIRQPAAGTLRMAAATSSVTAATFAPRITTTTSEGWVAIALFIPDAGGGGETHSGSAVVRFGLRSASVGSQGEVHSGSVSARIGLRLSSDGMKNAFSFNVAGLGVRVTAPAGQGEVHSGAAAVRIGLRATSAGIKPSVASGTALIRLGLRAALVGLKTVFTGTPAGALTSEYQRGSFRTKYVRKV